MRNWQAIAEQEEAKRQAALARSAAPASPPPPDPDPEPPATDPLPDPDQVKYDTWIEFAAQLAEHDGLVASLAAAIHEQFELVFIFLSPEECEAMIRKRRAELGLPEPTPAPVPPRPPDLNGLLDESAFAVALGSSDVPSLEGAAETLDVAFGGEGGGYGVKETAELIRQKRAILGLSEPRAEPLDIGRLVASAMYVLARTGTTREDVNKGVEYLCNAFGEDGVQGWKGWIDSQRQDWHFPSLDDPAPLAPPAPSAPAPAPDDEDDDGRDWRERRDAAVAWVVSKYGGARRWWKNTVRPYVAENRRAQIVIDLIGLVLIWSFSVWLLHLAANKYFSSHLLEGVGPKILAMGIVAVSGAIAFVVTALFHVFYWTRSRSRSF